METKKYNWKKTGIKVAIVAAEVIIAGLIAYVADKPELLVIAPILEGILDYLKHNKN